MMLCRWLLAALLCLAASAAGDASLLRGGGGVAAAYTDFCSEGFVAGSCTYAYDLEQRIVSTNTIPFQLTRLSDSATLNAGYTGSTFAVNVSALTTFCLGNGGTTTAETYSTQYNDCVFTTVYEQTGSGCDLVSGGPSTLGTTHAPFLQIRTSDGLPAIIQQGQSSAQTAAGWPATNNSAKWLYKNGCASLDGGVARTLVGRGNNAYFSTCCGQYGKIETAPAPGNTPAGAMYAVIFFDDGGMADYEADIEGGGVCSNPTTTTFSPIIDDVGVISYSATAGGSNTFLNDTLLGTANCTPHSAIATQDGMVIGCSGDYTSCGPIYFRGMVFLNIDVTLTAGLHTQIYNYLAALP